MIVDRPRLGEGPLGVDSSAWWTLAGAGAIVGLYHLLKPGVGKTEAGPVPPKEGPATFADLNAVATRLNQVRELYRMGYIDASDAITELATLMSAIGDLEKAGKTDAASARALAERIDAFMGDLGIV